MADERPPVWVGHVVVASPDIARAARFWEDVGMRAVEQNDHVAVLELRGGTHLVVTPGAADDPVPFDVMVDDVDAAHARFGVAGFDPSDIERGRIHDSFTIADPDGRRVKVNSSHVIGAV